MRLEQWIARVWYGRSPGFIAWLLWPIAVVFKYVVAVRRQLYQSKIFKTYIAPVPVIVVGNISVGGTGKTPCVIALVERLQKEGKQPGVVSRGYGRELKGVVVATDQSTPAQIGDEPFLIFQKTCCPLVVGESRVAAVKTLLAHFNCDVVISDDGLQHYALGRTHEMVVVDGARGFGNGLCLPSGPLREPVSRLQSVDTVVVNGVVPNGLDIAHPNILVMTLQLDEYVVELNTGMRKPLRDWQGGTVHAVAGIGHPERFFRSLEELGLRVVRHAFPDHHRYQLNEMVFNDDYPVLMTEKDAVKCRRLNLSSRQEVGFYSVGVVATLTS